MEFSNFADGFVDFSDSQRSCWFMFRRHHVHAEFGVDRRF